MATLPTRRTVISAAAVTICLVAMPNTATPQATILFKLPWKAILEGIAAAATICDVLGKYVFSDGASSFCKVPYNGFDQLQSECIQLSIELNSIDSEPSLVDGDSGLIPDLITYINKRSAKTWKAVRKSVSLFMTLAANFIRELGDFASQFDVIKSNFKADIDNLRNAYETIRQTVADVHLFTMAESSNDIAFASDFLRQIRPVPGQLERCRNDLASYADQRHKAACQN